MFGKHFASMYEGSMFGAGAVVFAVMGYVIANQEPDRTVGSQVELNPKLLAAILGEPVKEVEKAIDFLCSPDKESRSKDEGGRRLVKMGQFAYRVVNGAKYLKILDREARREYQRVKQAEYRAKRSPLMKGEAAANLASQSGASPEQVEQIISDSMPEVCRFETNGDEGEI